MGRAAEDMALEQEFNACAEEVKNKINKTLSDDELKEIYALFKQGTMGDITIEKPGMLDMKACAKWEAWNSKKGMEQEEAKKKYIEYAMEMKEKHGLAE